MNISTNAASIKARATAMWQAGFDFWKEPILIYKTAKETYISTNNSTYNFAYGSEGPGVSVNYITQSGIFQGIIEHIDQEDNQKKSFVGAGQNQTHNLVSEAKVRLTFETGALTYLKNLDKIAIDGRNYRILSDSQPRGMFERTQINIWCLPIE